MKKTILFASFLVLVFLAKPVSAEYIPMAGDLVKTPNDPAVYIIDDNLTRRMFQNASTFWTWYTGGWANLKLNVVPTDQLEQLDIGKHVTARPGTNLIRFSNGNKIYAVTPGGILCEVRALYGHNWQSRIVVLQPTYEIDYVRDNSCILTSDGKLPDATIIQYVGSKDFWYLDGGKKRKLTSEGFVANNFYESSVVRDVPVSMSYATDNRTISAFDYELGILRSLSDNRSTQVTDRPDLIISDIVFPTSRILTNQTITIKVIVKNIGGNLTSEKGLANVSFLGKDWITSNVSRPDYPSVTNPMLKNQLFEITYTGKFIASGSKNFTAKADEPSQVLEINERNNSLSRSVTVYSQ